VDNRPADSSTRLVVEAQAREDARVRYSAEPRPGSSVARNNGIVQTRAQIVAFTDDDVIVDRDWLAALVKPFLHDCQIAATTGLVLPAELETPAQWYFEQHHGFDKGFGPRVFDLQGHRAEGRLYPYWGGVFGPRHTMAFRRSVLREMGGFDPALGAGTLARAGEDVDAFTHLIVRGKRLAYEPRAICWHAHRRGDDALRHQLFDNAASLTAILTKWSLRNPALLLPMLRAVLTALRTSPSASSGENEPLLRQLHPFEIGGYVLGPILYLRSVARARRHGLAQMPLKDTAGPTSGEH
jgi:glycosyltransferase involved in cell wall biosynthesis